MTPVLEEVEALVLDPEAIEALLGDQALAVAWDRGVSRGRPEVIRTAMVLASEDIMLITTE